ncbi:TlpA disulfide reductase family protein [Flagellimonas hadalis]|uniref:AhpC/TSA family protein n=1 Tax=Flagellimonas hadalis TaxID=2597517 RepID=A0A5N5IXN9_9FLAO|nr:TlpA disulfide reductase family protein [Allomuricauda hadalis]KAB5491458.1 AhpC/TSA family protein [Allomuricauda hadalis]
MIKSNVFLAMMAVALFISCNTKTKQPEQHGFTIDGKVQGFPNGTKVYLTNTTTEAVFDSTEVQQGHFRFDGKLSAPPEQLFLSATVEGKLVYAFLFMGNDFVKISGDRSDFPWRVKVSGSKVQEGFNDLADLTKEYDVKRDSMTHAFMALTPEEQEQKGAEIWKEIGKIDSVSDGLRMRYVKTHNDTYASIIYLGYLKKMMPKDSVRAIYNRYTKEIKGSKYAKLVEVYLTENILEEGDRYQDFEGIDQTGKNVKFSEELGEEYTLLDFTSAFCGACILAADELEEINKTYPDILKIVEFSGDPNKANWQKALERDHVAWTSIWDGKGRYGETSIKYGVNAFPTFVLIGPDGTIVDKWIGYNKGSLRGKLGKHLEPGQ